MRMIKGKLENVNGTEKLSRKRRWEKSERRRKPVIIRVIMKGRR